MAQQLKNGHNDGGKNLFYHIPREKVSTVSDLAMWLGLDLAETKRFREMVEIFDEMNWYGVIPPEAHDLESFNFFVSRDSFFFGNYLKTLWISKGVRHQGTDKEREMKKRKHYTDRIEEWYQ